MTLRPAASDLLLRWTETACASGVAGLGLWSLAQGGYFFVPLGLLLVIAGGLWALIAVRRLRFVRPVLVPGLVEVDEGQISYFGPTFGGALALDDIAEVRLVAARQRLHWRLASAGGDVLLVPVDATGSDRLHDAFASLPGIDMALVSRALGRGNAGPPLWTRPRATLGRG